jgi:hypothetical protein
MRLLLGGGFNHSEPAIAAQMRKLYNACATLFESVLPVADRFSGDEANEVSTLDLLGDEEHRKPVAAVFIKPKYIRESLNLPQTSKDLRDPVKPFNASLRHAYRDDYDMPHIINLGKSSLKWCKRIGFTDK